MFLVWSTKTVVFKNQHTTDNKSFFFEKEKFFFKTPIVFILFDYLYNLCISTIFFKNFKKNTMFNTKISQLNNNSMYISNNSVLYPQTQFFLFGLKSV